MKLFSAASALLALQAGIAAAANSVSNTILVFARDSASVTVATLGLQGYGIPYQAVIVPEAGVALPTLNSSATQGNYGGILVLSEVSYQYSTGFLSALTTAQWQQLYDYQTAFGVRMVRLDVFPSTDLGVTTAISGSGCCDAGVEQLLSFTDDSAFSTANIKTGATVSTQGLWHYPATITNSSIATQIAKFGPSGSFTSDTTAAIINNIGGRQQMVWFISWATDWSQTSNYLQHSYIHWLTRGLFVGKRKLYLNTQVDDMHLETDIYYPSGNTFRIRTSDLNNIAAWQTDINTRLPTGSNYFVEIGHNGNGDIDNATDQTAGQTVCSPAYAVDYTSPPDTALEFQKPLGTGTDLWAAEFVNYTWSLACAELDPVASWFNQNPNIFAAVSHTFSHEELNNATYHDADREIYFNIAWLKQIGLWYGDKFSPNGIIPPAITGLHNGDAIRAWTDNGIKFVVGDNTRPVLRNQQNTFYPLISTVADNGYAGLTIIPRWATTIYYNCDTQECTTQEWITTSAGSGNFTTLLNDARTTNSRYLLGLHPDPYMFHQANLRTGDVDTITVGSVSGQLALIQIWVETITQELSRLTNWPFFSLKHDDIGQYFLDRVTLDACAPNLTYNYADDGKSITSVTVTATSNTCSVKVPVTFPGTASTTATGGTQDKVGTEPLIYWTQLSGSAVTYTLGSAVAVYSVPRSPQKKPRFPLGDLSDTAANEVGRVAWKSGKSACKEFEDARQPLAGVPAWLFKECMRPTEGDDVFAGNNSDRGSVVLKGKNVSPKSADVGEEDVDEENGSSASLKILEHVSVAGDLCPPEDWPENEHVRVWEGGTRASVVENDEEYLANRLQSLPAHTLRSIIYDLAVTDKTGELEARLAEADADQDVPSDIFGYQYCSAESIVTMLDQEIDHNDVENAQHMIEEVLLDIAGETSTTSPYSTKRAALVAILRVFASIFGFHGEGNRIAWDMPSDVEMNWASLFGEVFETLTMFEKQRLTTARDGLFLVKLDSTVSSIATADLGCGGREQGVLVELTKALVELGQHSECARRVEKLERAIAMDKLP
ncbi:hypothetical protein SLS53_001644 [Cytospora paraplurivora]|uniref:Extracellular serine-rich protein n=1 Tax=Cytospora paraplurivora TaxID=2898453 RepID=A0AAN9UG70_9PEZI